MTSAKPSLFVLLVNDHAEEIKLISTTLRGFFPDCRLEAVYTSQEALQWSLRDDWNLILVDDALSPRSGVEILFELKRNSPHAAIILQTDRNDSATALQALQQGADFLLFKQSPGFVTELLFYTQEALEKRALEIRLEHTFQRHLRLLESLSDLAYELDHEGRFVYVSPTVTSLLGYAPEDLAGRHFSILLPPTQEHVARYHMNERRAGARSAHQLELYVMGKGSGGRKERVMLMQLTAKGLYDERHRYLGTVGLLRDLSAQREHINKLEALETRLQEADRELAASRDAALSSQHLQQPLTALLHDSQRLLTTLQSIHFDQHVKQLAAYAAQATEVGYEVWKAAQFRGLHTHSFSLNSILNEVIAALSQEQSLPPETLELRFGRTQPGVVGNPEEMKELFRILIMYALQASAGAPAGPRLLFETYVLKLTDPGGAISPAMVSPAFRPYVVAVIRQGTSGSPMAIPPSTPRVSGPDFLRAHEIVRRHGGSIEIGSAVSPPFQIMVRLPATPSRPVPGLIEPPSDTKPSPAVHPSPATPSPSPATPEDRRRFGRISLRVPLELSSGTTTWQGTILDIGLGGMFFVSPQLTPEIEHQPVYLIIRTSVSFLELQGTVRYRSAGSGEAHSNSFIVEFTPLTKPEAAVLTSFIQSLQESSIGLTIEGLIPDTTDRARYLPSTQERRWYLRSRSARPVRIEFSSGKGQESFTGFLISLSKGGACIQMNGPSGPAAARLLAQSHEFPHIVLMDELIPQNLPAQIVWAQQPPANDSKQVGVCFSRLSLEAEARLNDVLASQWIRPESMFLPSRHGGSLAVSHDRFTDQISEDSPFLIISPGYAQTMIDYFDLASAFGRNGFRILRYDPTHALGLSDGDPRSMTLGSLKDDLEAVVEFAQRQWPRAPLVILASDISARVSLKLIGQRQVADMLLLIDPILDLQGALHDLHHRDLVEEHKAGSQFGLVNLLGLPIDADRFLDDAIAGGYVDFPSVLNDISRLRCRVRLLTTPPVYRTTLGRPGTMEGALLQEVMEALGDRGAAVSLSCPIAGEERLSERHRETFHSLITQCKDVLSPGWTALDFAHETDPAAISTQHRYEIEQLRLKPHIAPLDRADLWARYTQYNGILSEIPSYLQHANELYQTIHPFRERQSVLDVGCSHYGFARLWLLNGFYRSSFHPFRDRPDMGYTGVDMRVESVRSAREAFTVVRRQSSMASRGMPATPPPDFSRWIIGDAASLPFGNDLFDCIVCHFVLSFAINPSVMLRQLYRLLRPNGTLIVSSLTPSADLASVYRAYLDETGQDGLSDIHRNLLLDLARLYESIRCRRLHSFTKQSLVALFDQMTGQPARIFPSLDGHVLVAAVQKPDSARRI